MHCCFTIKQNKEMQYQYKLISIRNNIMNSKLNVFVFIIVSVSQTLLYTC